MSALSDDEQFDSLKSFTKKYGSAMISGILIALIAFFGWEYWQKKNLAVSQTETAKVQQLMDSASTVQGDAFSQLSTATDSIMKESPDSVQAIQAQLVMAKYSSPHLSRSFVFGRVKLVLKRSRTHVLFTNIELWSA